jgi:hypothetical protein
MSEQSHVVLVGSSRHVFEGIRLGVDGDDQLGSREPAKCFAGTGFGKSELKRQRSSTDRLFIVRSQPQENGNLIVRCYVPEQKLLERRRGALVGHCGLHRCKPRA